MDINNNNLRNKLNEPSSLPNDLHWENMEEGVFKKLEDLKTIDKENRRRRLIFFLFLFGISFLISIVIFYLISIPTQNLDNLPTTLLDESNLYSNNNGKSPLKDELEYDITKKPDQSSDHSKSKFNQSSISFNPIKRKESIYKNESSFSNNLITRNVTDNSSIIHFDDQYSKNLEIKKVISDNKKLASKQSRNVSELNKIGTINLRNVSSNQTDHIPAIKHLPFLSSDNAENINTKSQINFYSGISFWDFGYSSSLTDRDYYETNLPSFSSQLEYTYNFKNNWILLAGISYQRLESRLDWTKEIDDYSITLENVIIENNTNALTGQKDFVLGDVDLNVNAERVVKHYNRATLIQLPVGIGIRRQIGKVVFCAAAGSSFNIISSFNGRLISNNTIIDYNGNANDFFNNKLKLNGFLQACVSYKVNQNIAISTSFGYHQSFSNWSSEESFKMFPKILSIQLGASYHFNR